MHVLHGHPRMGSALHALFQPARTCPSTPAFPIRLHAHVQLMACLTHTSMLVRGHAQVGWNSIACTPLKQPICACPCTPACVCNAALCHTQMQNERCMLVLCGHALVRWNSASHAIRSSNPLAHAHVHLLCAMQHAQSMQEQSMRAV